MCSFPRMRHGGGQKESQSGKTMKGGARSCAYTIERSAGPVSLWRRRGPTPQSFHEKVGIR
ncbi:hypothetical protein BGW80DRAFT_1271741 [Lactifluus volemus]|nr:hypothetical protein BGW80DRAFT_1271741 [Lactifluus volemus]